MSELPTRADLQRDLEIAWARIAELEAESASQKDVIDMLAQPKAEIEAERLCWVRGLTAVCADVAELDREIVLEIGKLRGEG